ncbi:50S ribosomal protein L33 [Candidatus Shikimatogenerans silvanidophilus]|uniref:50S ribosomal protein L33 n=1 Tax=Candidatus Shikimatogenerans silvanidophilus TaxID=2782547 RepID=UPI001BAB72B1|nr:50S ribosomal protein L33 [Candidatus Shikimatogenerans silvanidophilus]
MKKKKKSKKNKKKNRKPIILECIEHKKIGLPGISRYSTIKNKKTTNKRIEIKKYNRILKKHTIHKEIK